jgi:hypothetical protein
MGPEGGFTGATGSTGTTGATGPAGPNSNTFQTTVSGIFIGPPVVGMVVTPQGSDVVFLSIANAPGRQNAAGVLVAIAAGVGTVQYRDRGVLTTAQWDAVTGQVGGLTPGPYYVSAAAQGMLTTVQPVAPGSFVTQVGLALNPTTLLLQPSIPIGPHP